MRPAIWNYSNARDAQDAQEATKRMAERKLEQARTALKLAEARKSEIQMQEHDLAVMESTVRQAPAAVGVADAQLQAAKASAKMFEIQLRDTKIFAPCDGMVVTRAVEPGEVVAAGATTLVVIDFGKLYLKGYLPNNRISQIKLNDPARIFLDAFPGKILRRPDHQDQSAGGIHPQERGHAAAAGQTGLRRRVAGHGQRLPTSSSRVCPRTRSSGPIRRPTGARRRTCGKANF